MGRRTAGVVYVVWFVVHTIVALSVVASELKHANTRGVIIFAADTIALQMAQQFRRTTRAPRG